MPAGQLTLYGAQQVLGMAFGQISTPPDNFYLALTTSLATLNMNGSEISEPPGASNYSRLKIPNSTLNWTTSANAPYVMNKVPMSWPLTPTLGATADWPRCPGWALCDALTGGNLWVVGTLSVPIANPAGFCVYLGVNALSLELSPFFSIQQS